MGQGTWEGPNPNFPPFLFFIVDASTGLMTTPQLSDWLPGFLTITLEKVPCRWQARGLWAALHREVPGESAPGAATLLWTHVVLQEGNVPCWLAGASPATWVAPLIL